MIKRKAIFTLASMVFVPTMQQSIASLTEAVTDVVEEVKTTADSATDVVNDALVTVDTTVTSVELKKEFVELPTI